MQLLKFQEDMESIGIPLAMVMEKYSRNPIAHARSQPIPFGLWIEKTVSTIDAIASWPFGSLRYPFWMDYLENGIYPPPTDDAVQWRHDRFTKEGFASWSLYCPNISWRHELNNGILRAIYGVTISRRSVDEFTTFGGDPRNHDMVGDGIHAIPAITIQQLSEIAGVSMTEPSLTTPTDTEKPCCCSPQELTCPWTPFSVYCQYHKGKKK